MTLQPVHENQNPEWLYYQARKRLAQIIPAIFLSQKGMRGQAGKQGRGGALRQSDILVNFTVGGRAFPGNKMKYSGSFINGRRFSCDHIHCSS